MNIDKGNILSMDITIYEREAILRRLVPVEEKLMTEKQRTERRVSLHDHTSALGKQLTAARSKYVPHIGAKQLAKAAKRAATQL